MKTFIPTLLLCFCIGQSCNIYAQKSTHTQNYQHAIITIHVQGADDGDRIHVIKNTINLRTPETRFDSWLQFHNQEINIRFDSMKHPEYFLFNFKKLKTATDSEFLVEPADSIYIFIDGTSVNFTGRGALKLKCGYEIERSKIQYAKNLPKVATLEKKYLFYNYCDTTLAIGLKILNSYHHKISNNAFQVLKADLLGMDLDYRIEISGFEGYPKSNPAERKAYDSNYLRLNRHIVNIKDQPNEKMAAYSFYWARILLKKYFIDSFYMRSKPFDLQEQYRYVLQHYHGTMRNHLITSLLHNYNQASDNLVLCLKDAVSVIKDTEFRAILYKQYIHYQQGTKAFDFSLPDSSGKIVRLTDFTNKTIIMDFWYTGCINCIEASTALLPIEDLYKEKKDLVFLSICIDRDKNTWIRSLKGGKYSAPGRINLYTNQQGSDDSLIKYYDIFAYPTMIMVGKNGKLLSARLSDPRTNNGEQLIKQIKTALAL